MSPIIQNVAAASATPNGFSSRNAISSPGANANRSVDNAIPSSPAASTGTHRREGTRPVGNSSTKTFTMRPLPNTTSQLVYHAAIAAPGDPVDAAKAAYVTPRHPVVPVTPISRNSQPIAFADRRQATTTPTTA